MATSNSTIPTNPTTGRDFSGKQSLELAVIADENGYQGQFAGFHQWLDAGRAVQKGQHGFKILLPVLVKDKKTGDKKPYFKRATVFAIEQTQVLEVASV